MQSTHIKSRDLSLDGIRGLAAFMVFLYHLRWIAGEPKLMVGGLNWMLVLSRFDIGVCLFFVLSGYLLSGPFWEGALTGRWPNLERYAIRRLARILPAYWCVLIVFAVLSQTSYSMWGAIALTLQTLGIHTFSDYTYHGIVPVLWSIGIEIQYYALLPLLFLAAAFLSRRSRWIAPLALTALIAVSGVLWQAGVSLLVGHVPGKILPSASSMVITESVFHYLKWFGIGIAAAGIVKYSPWVRKWKPLHWDLATCLSIAGIVLAIASSSKGEWRRVSLAGWPLSALACGFLVFAAPRSRLAIAVFEHSIMRFMGSISYGVYLWHRPVLKAVFGGTLPARLGPVSAFFIGGAIGFFVTVAIAWLVHVVVERPAILWATQQRGIADAVRSIRVWFSLSDRDNALASSASASGRAS